MMQNLATVAAAILFMCLGGCSTNAPMAPIGLDKYLANDLATIRADRIGHGRRRSAAE